MNSKKISGISEGCRDYLDWIAHERNIKIQSALHGGFEKKIGSYKVDGFCQELSTVFEFYGDYWHAHSDLFPDENAQHPTRSMMIKIKLLLPLKKLETTIVNDYSIYRTGAIMLKSSRPWRVIGIHLLKIVLKSKPTFHNFLRSLTFTGKK